MTGTALAALVRQYTGTNTVTLTNATLVLLANTVKDDFAPEIMKADEKQFALRSTVDLVASATTREYPLPDDTLKIERVEVLFVTGGRWIKLKKFSLGQFNRPTDEATIIENFSNDEGNCFYDVFRKTIKIYSGTITAVTAGLLLESIAYPADIAVGDLSGVTDLCIDPSNTTSQLPRQFHELWARKISILWKSGHQKPLPLSAHEQNFSVDFKKKMDALSGSNGDEEVTGSIPYNDGSQY